MATVNEQKDKLAKKLAEAERRHNTGDLSGALKIYRSVLKETKIPETVTEIQHKIDELHDMLTFVESVQEDDKANRKEQILDWLKDNTIPIFAGLILLTTVLLLFTLFPILLRQLEQASGPIPEPTPSEELPDTFLEGDTSATVQELKGNREDSGTPIKETSTRITLTVPKEFLSPYPIRYVIKAQAPVYPQAHAKSPPVKHLPLNTPVQLRGKNQDLTWLQIGYGKDQLAWIESRYLADRRYRSPAEVDADIKAALGNRYWRIEVKGTAAPFSYFLLVNAPNSDQASAALLEGYQKYASKQLVTMLNTYSHQKVKNIEVSVLSQKNSKSSLDMELSLVWELSNGQKQMAGQKHFSIPKRENGRFFLYHMLEGI